MAFAQAGFPVLVMQLRGLRALLAVIEHGTTVGAAQAVHLSQPAVTRAIGRLEEACEQALFERTTRGMRPTPQGEQIAARARVFFDRLRQGAHEALVMEAARQPRRAGAERFAQAVSAGQIRALVAVAAVGSESQAALQLGISQPAVHASLQELEQLLALTLFYKRSSGTRLTPPGEALLLRVKQAVAELRGMEGDLAAWQGQARGQLVIGVLPLSVPIFLPRALERFMAGHPAVQVRIVDGTYENLVQLLLSADIDVIAGALRAQPPSADVQQHPLFDDELVVVAHRDHPCLAQRRKLSLRQLLDWPWVAPLAHTPAERVLHRAFEAQGLLPPARQLSANSPLMTLSLVMQSGLLAIASRGQVLLNDFGGLLRVVPVALPGTSRRIGIATRASSRPAPHLQAFIDICRTGVH
ncbi:LysR substrate-binding domain-containing protein [Xenophilus arseniciresistens]|uniref:LysR substrate-binding domain-containing protein n=1 Tax=Xenophilus arseniciresistens TaxID=1283306 RepID=A0AAE3N9H1_9BURK|nr:LysR substrate-binding domain-containing protein [Xenophilus arseniciresistens]MDA7416292.1 LysR substrate-binding domain-containing protein [Xenophilus arseniciresistens]